MAATCGWRIWLAFSASRLKRVMASGSCARCGFITFTALLRFMRTCSARYTVPIPPAPSLRMTWYRSAIVSPTRSSPARWARSVAPSSGQNRVSGGYWRPHCGQIFTAGNGGGGDALIRPAAGGVNGERRRLHPGPSPCRTRSYRHAVPQTPAELAGAARRVDREVHPAPGARAAAGTRRAAADGGERAGHRGASERAVSGVCARALGARVRGGVAGGERGRVAGGAGERGRRGGRQAGAARVAPGVGRGGDTGRGLGGGGGGAAGGAAPRLVPALAAARHSRRRRGRDRRRLPAALAPPGVRARGAGGGGGERADGALRLPRLLGGAAA